MTIYNVWSVRVTACVDSVAASGGYMLACVAHKVVASPFAYVGSIGVMAQVRWIWQMVGVAAGRVTRLVSHSMFCSWFLALLVTRSSS